MNPKEQVAMLFAKQLANVLDKDRTGDQYGRLVLVAEPRFLGELRSALSLPTAAMVTATVDRDLGGTSERDLPTHLNGVVSLSA
jgi:protein required for attachment to host cells